MLIISKFRDYYDTAIAFGVDKTIVYERQQEEHGRRGLLRYNNRHGQYEVRSNKYIYTYQRHIIGFTGNLYPVLEITKHKKWGTIKGEEVGTKFFYSDADLEAHLNNEGVEQKISWWGGFNLPFGRINTKTFFSTNTWSKHKDIFMEYKTPAFLLSNEKLILNPVLKDYKFAKIKDPFTAFQDIMQYISGVLGIGEPNMIDISNDDMRDKKGFNDWSFKTHPSDAKKPRGKKR